MSMEPDQKLKDLFPGLKRLEINTHLDFREDNEIHLLRIPRNVDPELLLNFDFNVYEKEKIKIGDEKYVIQPLPRETNPTLIVSAEGKIVDLKSNIIMKKYFKKKHPVVFKSEKTVMPVPNSKKRHPLFGEIFEEKIELSADIEEKLNNALEKLMKQDIKSNKQKKREKDHKVHDDEIIFSLLNSQNSAKEKNSVESVSDNEVTNSATKKKKKSKKTLEEKSSKNIKSELFTECETDSGIVSGSNKKIKKTKKSLIEESLRSIKNKLFPEGETDSEFILGSAKKSKKSKKSVDGKSLSDIKNEVFTEYETDSGVTPKKKKNKNILSESNCLTSSKLVKKEFLNNSLNFELGSSKSSTRKRKLSTSVARTSDSEEGGITDKLSKITSSEEKKIKKSKLNSTSDNMILNGFNIEDSPKKVKKKKKHYFPIE